MKRSGAFTLTELLVLVGVSGFLGAVLLPSLAADKRVAVRAACAQNERQLGLAWQMFATDHNGKVGIGSVGGGGYLWDISAATRDNLMNQYTAPRKVFYCPSNPAKNLDAYWNCQACGGSSVGYWLVIQRVDTNFQPITTSPWNGSTMLTYGPTDPKYKFVYDLSHSSDPSRPLQVLLTDAIISDNSSPPNFTNVTTTVGPVTLQSPHLGTNGVPEGSNICYTDGHVEWKDMSILKRRFTPGGGDASRYMWW